MKRFLPTLCLFMLQFGLQAQEQTTGHISAVHFDGVDDYISLDPLVTHLSTLNDLTIEFWMKADYTTNTSSIRTNFFAVNRNYPYDNKFSIVMGGPDGAQTGQLIVYEADAATPAFYTSSQVIGDNVCHHIAYVRSVSMGIGKVYIDGVLIGTRPVGTAVESTNRISLGQEWDYDVPSDFYNGYMDEFRIWSYTRTQDEIVADMNHPLSGTETGLVAYYNFNEGVPGADNTGHDILHDLGPGAYSGTLYNFALTGLLSNWVNQECTIATAVSKEEERITGVSIYPNPAETYIQVSGNIGKYHLELFNVQGKLVKQITSNGSTALSIVDLPAGMYTVVLEENNRRTTHKLVKTN